MKKFLAGNRLSLSLLMFGKSYHDGGVAYAGAHYDDTAAHERLGTGYEC